jgi:diguanylate cyclase (GGDEF)-like protein
MGETTETLLVGFARIALAEVDVDRALHARAAALLRETLDAAHVEILRLDGRALATIATEGPAVSPQRPGEAIEVQVGETTSPLGLVRVVRPSAPMSDEDVGLVRGVADLLGVAIERAAAERTRREDADRDALTGLLGRERFAQELGSVLPCGGTLMLLDLDDFGLVNETLGPHAGDLLLRAVAQRVRSAVGARVRLARVGGDELAVFDPSAVTETAAVDLARRLQVAVGRAFDLEDAMHHVSASIGIVVCAAGAYDDEREAIRDAHVAGRRAKELGRGRHELFDAEARAALERRRALEQELRAGLERDEFRLVFQPIVALGDRRVIGAETLVRWAHPTRGVVGPNEFIEAAEASDLIIPLGAWILREAFRQLKAWATSGPGYDGFRLSINLSGRQLAEPAFPATVRRLLHAHDLDPAQVVFELTETALADETPQVEQAFAELRSLGVGMALDDFGTGYASLSYVRRFAFDSLKLDGSFVAGIDGDPQDAALITAAISMGHAMHMDVVAEGVETVEQVDA